MTPTRKQLIEFSLEMGRRTRATVRQCEALLRYAGSLKDHYGCACDVNQPFHDNNCPVRKRERIKKKIWDICDDLGTRPVFTGAVLRIRVPDGGEVVVPS